MPLAGELSSSQAAAVLEESVIHKTKLIYRS